MRLPPNVDALIRQRFEELVTVGKDLARRANASNEINNRNLGTALDYRGGSLDIERQPYSIESAFIEWKTNVLSLLGMLTNGKDQVTHRIEEVRAYGYSAYAEEILGIVKGLKSDYETGILISLAQHVEANIAADYLRQAEQLLGEGVPGQYDYVPAAVLLGAILESNLRQLCRDQNPPIPTVKANSDPKMLNALIEDLANANVFNKMMADKLRSWAKIRNYAAHGEFTQFSRADVDQMYSGVQDFLAKYL